MNVSRKAFTTSIKVRNINYNTIEQLTQISSLYEMYLCKDPNHVLPIDQNRIIQNAFRIYECVETECKHKHYPLLSQLLSICLRFNCSNKAFSLWQNVQHLTQSQLKEKKHVNELQFIHQQFIKCCINANHVNINQFIETVEWMKTHHMKSIELDCSQITKLIQKCSNTHSLLYVDKLLKQQFIKYTHSIIIHTAFITRFGKFGDTSNALKIFYSLDHRNIVCYGVIMSVLIENKRYEKALELYRNVKMHKNVSIHTLAIKACTNGHYFETGECIIDSNELCTKYMENNHDNIRLKTTLIDFFGHFKNIKQSIHIFKSIDGVYKDMIVINAMMKAYGNNNLMCAAYELFVKHESCADKETFVILFNGFAHDHCAGAMKKVIDIWECELMDKSIKYDALVMSALVDGLSRKGYLYGAYEYIIKYNKYHKRKDKIMYTSLLSGCRNWNNKHLAMYIYKRIHAINTSQNRKASIHRLLSCTQHNK